MSENQFSTIDTTDAKSLMRHVGANHALEAGVLNPAAPTRSVRLQSLMQAERFLVVRDGDNAFNNGRPASLNYVEPDALAVWVTDILGDDELGEGLHDLIETQLSYNHLVPPMKDLITERLTQCRVALGIA